MINKNEIYVTLKLQEHFVFTDFFHLFFSRLNIPKGTLIPLTKQDQMKLDSILKRPYITCQPFWRKEVCFFLKFKCMFYCLLL